MAVITTRPLAESTASASPLALVRSSTATRCFANGESSRAKSAAVRSGPGRLIFVSASDPLPCPISTSTNSAPGRARAAMRASAASMFSFVDSPA